MRIVEKRNRKKRTTLSLAARTSRTYAENYKSYIDGAPIEIVSFLKFQNGIPNYFRLEENH